MPQGWESFVDTTALVRSCVQSAVGMLRDQVEGGGRSTRRVEILLTLLSNNEEIRGVQTVTCFPLILLIRSCRKLLKINLFTMILV